MEAGSVGEHKPNGAFCLHFAQDSQLGIQFLRWKKLHARSVGENKRRKQTKWWCFAYILPKTASWESILCRSLLKACSSASEHSQSAGRRRGGRGGKREVEMCYDRFLLKERGRGFLINFLLKGGGRVVEMWLDLSAVRGLYAKKYHTWVSWFTIVTLSGAYEVGLVLLFMGILVQNSYHIGGVC